MLCRATPWSRAARNKRGFEAALPFLSAARPCSFDATNVFGEIAWDHGMDAAYVGCGTMNGYIESVISIGTVSGRNVRSEAARRKLAVEILVDIYLDVYPGFRLQITSHPSI